MKYQKLEQKGIAHWLVPLVVVAVMAIVGVRVIYTSHAAAPGVSADKAYIPSADFRINPKSSAPVKTVPEVAAPDLQATGGILPPSNPSESLAPSPNFFNDGSCPYYVYTNTSTCNNDVISATDNALNILESLPPLSFNTTAFQNLTAPEQLFVIINIERVNRGLSPVAALTTQLNAVAQTGASNNADPDLTSTTLTGGGQPLGWGSIFAGGTNNPLGSDYYWMYDDGLGGVNGDCTTSDQSGCWGHRDVILGTSLFDSYCSSNPNTYMGAGYTSGSSSTSTLSTYAAIIVGTCNFTPTDVVFTWQQALQLLNPTVTPPTAPQDVAAVPSKKAHILLTWQTPSSDNGASVTSYKIYRSTKPKKEKLIKTVNCTSDSCSFINTSTSAGKTYYYVIGAINSAGQGPLSLEVSVKAN